MDRSLWRKCSKYTLSVIAFLIGTEIVYKCIQYFYTYLRSEGDGESMYYYKVLFFPDEGILSNLDHQKPEDLCTDVLDTAATTKVLSLDDDFTPKNTLFGTSSLLRDSCRSSPPRSLFNPLLKSTSLIHMVNVLDAAERSLLVCVYLVSSSDLLDAIIRAKDRGVRVRIILDRGMSSVSNLAVLLKSSIPIRYSKPSQMMHNKFAIADALEDVSRLETIATNDSFPAVRCMLRSRRGKPKESGGVLMTGSFNWTWNAVISNYENVVVTNDHRLVAAYAKEFEKLWDLFSQTELKNLNALDCQNKI
ncbi:uncharacterized protein zuc [Palaemon carinicauda]|uniref:uncharacterized protein zuc n=1 Tax=Palaemon carinicauda TaxID=392227 RepID=UPI0035B5C4DE